MSAGFSPGVGGLLCLNSSRVLACSCLPWAWSPRGQAISEGNGGGPVPGSCGVPSFLSFLCPAFIRCRKGDRVVPGNQAPLPIDFRGRLTTRPPMCRCFGASKTYFLGSIDQRLSEEGGKRCL